MLKKTISIVLAFVLVFSMLAAACVTTSAQLDENGAYVPGSNVTCGTNRYYFWMPNSWYNEKFGADNAGCYWWGGTDSSADFGGEDATDQKWPGYKMQLADKYLSLFYIDCPKDVEMVIFNNFLDGGDRKYAEGSTNQYIYETSEEQYFAAKQTVDVASSFYTEGDDEFYDTILSDENVAMLEAAIPELKGKLTIGGYTKTFFEVIGDALDGENDSFFGDGTYKNNFYENPKWGYAMNFDNMVCMPDIVNPIPDHYNGKYTYPTEWYFYYGNGEYGPFPNKEWSEAVGMVKKFSDAVTPDEPDSTVPPTNPTSPTEPAPTPGENMIYFDVAKSGWNNVRTVYCHIWKADGTQTNTGNDWPDWQSKREKCTYDTSTRIAAFDLANTGNNFSKDDGKIYCVIFSTNTGMQTYQAIMSGSCIGDTMYITGETLENPEDSQRFCVEASWRNNPDCGAVKTITSTGNIVGYAHPDGETDATMMASFLITYYDVPEKMEYVPSLMDTLNLKSDDVLVAVSNKLTVTDNPDKDRILAKVTEVLRKYDESLVLYCGDADGDGEITVSDATEIQKSIVGYAINNAYFDLVSDVDGDGEITVSDATEIQKYIVGLPCSAFIGERV